MPFASSDDVNLYYEIKGTGPRLLYISGTGADLRRPPNVFSSSFPDTFETLGYDQRGLGQSGKPDRPYSMAEYGDDAARLLDSIGWNDCLVIGISFGGMVAQEFAINHSERVKKLVLGCTATGGEGGSSFPLHTLQDLPIEEKVRVRMSKNDVRLNEEWQLANPSECQELIDQAIAAANFAADEPGRAMGARRQLEARAEHDTYDRVQQLSMPVMVCGGKFDGQAEPEVVENLANCIPGAKLAYYEGGHMFMQQDPNAAKDVKAFLLD